MSNRKLSDTSLSAYKMVHPDMKISHWGKILFAMRLLGVPASMESISKKAGMGLPQVSRRMNELEKETLVHKDGKGVTQSGRSCYLYSISNQAEAQKHMINSQSTEEFFENYQNGHFPNLPEQPKGAYIQQSLL